MQQLYYQSRRRGGGACHTCARANKQVQAASGHLLLLCTKKKGGQHQLYQTVVHCGVSKFSNSNIILCRVVYMKKQQHQFICVQCLCDSQVPFIINLALFLMFFIGIICALAVVFGYFPADPAGWLAGKSRPAGRHEGRQRPASNPTSFVIFTVTGWPGNSQQ